MTIQHIHTTGDTKVQTITPLPLNQTLSILKDPNLDQQISRNRVLDDQIILSEISIGDISQTILKMNDSDQSKNTSEPQLDSQNICEKVNFGIYHTQYKRNRPKRGRKFDQRSKQIDLNSLEEDEEFAFKQRLIQKKAELLQIINQISNPKKILIFPGNRKILSTSDRGSQYRGISRNGKKWQVQLLGTNRKRYIGQIASELEAAYVYDRYAIMAHGMKAKTNFCYSKEEIELIIESFSHLC